MEMYYCLCNGAAGSGVLSVLVDPISAMSRIIGHEALEQE